MSKCQKESCAASPTVTDYRSIFYVIHLAIVESGDGLYVSGASALSQVRKHYSKQSINLVLTTFHTHSRQTLIVISSTFIFIPLGLFVRFQRMLQFLDIVWWYLTIPIPQYYLLA